MSTRAVVLAAPTSGAGKTVISLGVMAALRARGLRVRAAKSGPDYIDPAFHEAATGATSVNLDAWAMAPGELRKRANAQAGDILIVEGAMGVLDGAANGPGSSADLAAALDVPLALIVDIAKAGQSAALAPAGLATLRPDVEVAGVILNRSGSARHVEIATSHLEGKFKSFGAVARNPALSLPERHLGLVQAGETEGLQNFLRTAAEIVEDSLDLDALVDAASPIAPSTSTNAFAPLGQRIAVAQDVAFAFSYPHISDDWHNAGAQIMPFSPLLDQGPDPVADAVFLPGGYPELHAGQLSSATEFQNGMKRAAQNGATIYGECGGYMVLGDTLIDAEGLRYPMLGLLPHETSFQNRKLSLGYRKLKPLGGPFEGEIAAHEFHYATISNEGAAQRMFEARDANDAPLGELGMVRNNVSGSFAHIIAPAHVSV